jgi:hypothetical protein
MSLFGLQNNQANDLLSMNEVLDEQQGFSLRTKPIDQDSMSTQVGLESMAKQKLR